MSTPELIAVEVFVNRDTPTVWTPYTDPRHVMRWNFAIPEWCCPKAASDLRPGGAFSYRMEARDGSMGFDFARTFLEIDAPRRIVYTLGDKRRVATTFRSIGTGTEIRQEFTPESTHTIDQQRNG